MAFAGIAISPVEEDYIASVSLVSDHDGSIIGTKTSSSSPLSSLTKTIEGLISDIREIKLNACGLSISSALDAGRNYDLHKALESLETSAPRVNPTLMHGEAYTIAHLEKEEEIRVLFVDFISPNQFSATFYQGNNDDGKRATTIIHEEKVDLSAISKSTAGSAPNTLKAFKGAISSRRSEQPVQRIIVNNLPSEANFATDVEAEIAAEYPGISIVKITPERVAEAAALSLYAKSLLAPEGRILAQYGMPLPVSIASPTGSIITLVPSGYRIPCDQYVTLTNSKDDQESATIRILLGNHPLAKDNLERAVVTFNDLKPLPKGEARIRVHIKVSHLDGWRDAATITVSQDGGPTKSYLFPRLLAGLPDNADDEYIVSNKKEDNYVQYSDEVVGELSE